MSWIDETKWKFENFFKYDVPDYFSNISIKKPNIDLFKAKEHFLGNWKKYTVGLATAAILTVGAWQINKNLDSINNYLGKPISQSKILENPNAAKIIPQPLPNKPSVSIDTLTTILDSTHTNVDTSSIDSSTYIAPIITPIDTTQIDTTIIDTTDNPFVQNLPDSIAIQSIYSLDMVFHKTVNDTINIKHGDGGLHRVIAKYYNKDLHKDGKYIIQKSEEVVDYKPNEELQPELKRDAMYINRDGNLIKEENVDNLRGDILKPGKLIIPTKETKKFSLEIVELSDGSFIDPAGNSYASLGEVEKSFEEANKKTGYTLESSKAELESVKSSVKSTSSTNPIKTNSVSNTKKNTSIITPTTTIENKVEGSQDSILTSDADSIIASIYIKHNGDAKDIQTIYNNQTYGSKGIKAVMSEYNVDRQNAKNLLTEARAYVGTNLKYKSDLHKTLSKEEKSIVLKTIMNGGTLKEQNKNLVDEISSSFTYNSRIMFANKMLSELGINKKVTKIKDLTKHESYIQKQLQNYC